MTRAIVYTPGGEYGPHADRCMDYCKAQGYEVDSLARDWETVEQVLRGGVVGVAVVARADHLPPHHRPRIEIAAETGAPASAKPTNRRPRPL